MPVRNLQDHLAAANARSLQAAGVEGDGERVAVQLAAEGVGPVGLIAAARGRLNAAGRRAGGWEVSRVAAARSRLTALASSAVPMVGAAGNPAGIVRLCWNSRRWSGRW